MGTTHNAHVLFRQLPAGLKAKVFEIAAGKLLYFPSKTRRTPVDKMAVCERYAKGKSYRDIAEQLGISRARAWQIVKQERDICVSLRIEYWRKRGLSLREVARLFKKSRETMRQAIS